MLHRIPIAHNRARGKKLRGVVSDKKKTALATTDTLSLFLFLSISLWIVGTNDGEKENWQTDEVGTSIFFFVSCRHGEIVKIRSSRNYHDYRYLPAIYSRVRAALLNQIVN